MAVLRKLRPFRLALSDGDTSLEIVGMQRDGSGLPLVLLHGFGSTKEDYAEVIQQPTPTARPVLAFDAPGCGASTCGDLWAICILFLSRSPKRCSTPSVSIDSGSSVTPWVG